MARNVQQIQTQLQQELAAQQALGNLTGLTSVSMSAIYTCWFFIIAVAIAFEEQQQDAFTSNLETIANNAVWRTPAWIQAQSFLYQYGSVLTVNPTTLEMYYTTVIPSQQIINACAVVITPNGVTNVKVATGSPLGALSSPQLVSYKAFLTTILGSGTQLNVLSQSADVLNITGTIFVNGQDPNVLTNVINALLNYMNLIPFNGTVRLSDVETVILGVPTVTDWQPSSISAVAGSNPTFYLINNNLIQSRNYPTVAGYIATDGNLSTSLTVTVAQS